MRHFEALIDSLMKWLQATGEQPTELVLPTKLFLNLAADLQGGKVYEASVGSLPLRSVHQFVAHSFGSVRPDERNREEWREVRVGDTFIVQGPGGPITIREAK